MTNKNKALNKFKHLAQVFCNAPKPMLDRAYKEYRLCYVQVNYDVLIACMKSLRKDDVSAGIKFLSPLTEAEEVKKQGRF